VSVTHPSSTLPVTARDSKQISGEVERVPGGGVEISIRLLERQHVVAARSAEADFEMWRENHKSIPEMMIYLLNLTPETLAKKASPRRPTESPTAALLYFEAARLAKMPQLDKALLALDRAIGEDPKFALPYWGKGQVLRAVSKALEADEWESKAAEIDDDHPRTFAVGELANPLPSLMRALQTSEWRTLRNRLSFKETAVAAYGIEFNAWAFYPADYRLDAIASENETGATVQELRQQSGAVLVVNGGFFDIDQRSRLTPSGLLISNGKRIAASTAKEKGGSGVVYERAGAVDIDFIQNLVIDNNVVAAIQVGPLVVDPGGKNGIRRNDFDRQNRSAIGRDRSGKIVIIVVTGGLSLFEIGEVLSAKEADGGFDCERALNLDGGPSTAASFSIDGKSTELMGRWKILDALAVKSR
jgi:uncharacterized protein YigE (DUF2233 family)